MRMPIDFHAQATYISKKNLELTLEELVKTLKGLRDDVAFDFEVKIQQRKETSE